MKFMEEDYKIVVSLEKDTDKGKQSFGIPFTRKE